MVSHDSLREKYSARNDTNTDCVNLDCTFSQNIHKLPDPLYCGLQSDQAGLMSSQGTQANINDGGAHIALRILGLHFFEGLEIRCDGMTSITVPAPSGGGKQAHADDTSAALHLGLAMALLRRLPDDPEDCGAPDAHSRPPSRFP